VFWVGKQNPVPPSPLGFFVQSIGGGVLGRVFCGVGCGCFSVLYVESTCFGARYKRLLWSASMLRPSHYY
jgi:hypothetical protein